MSEEQALKRIFQIASLKLTSLATYFEALKYICIHKEKGNFLYVDSNEQNLTSYSVWIENDEISKCNCKLKEVLDLDSLTEFAIEQYGFIPFPTGDDPVIVLDNEEYRLFILKPMEEGMHITSITLIRRIVPLEQVETMLKPLPSL